MADATPPAFTFIDLFAGIGGIRTAFEDDRRQVRHDVGVEQVRATDLRGELPDDGDGHVFHGDITTLDERDVPEHDVLLGGFPCQPFSIAGVSKKNALGRPHGFEDPTQGTLFFDIKRIIDEKRPDGVPARERQEPASRTTGAAPSRSSRRSWRTSSATRSRRAS